MTVSPLPGYCGCLHHSPAWRTSSTPRRPRGPRQTPCRCGKTFPRLSEPGGRAHPATRLLLNVPATRGRAGSFPRLLLDAAAGGHLADPEDHELGRLHRREADLDDQLARVDDLGRVGLGVALDVERLLRSRPHQGARAPQERQERGDRPLHALPEAMVVGLEDDPLGRALDRRLHHDEQAADVDVAPARIRRQGAGAPDADRAVHEADAVDALRVEQVLLALRDVVAQAERATDDLVGRRLVDTALAVDARVHAGDVTRRGNEDVALVGVVDLDPREVVRAVLRVTRTGEAIDAALDG